MNIAMNSLPGGLLEVTHPGLGNGIQDDGRVGYRHMGITVSGSLDPLLAHCANALVGNPPGAACLELRALGPALLIRQGPVRLAVAGNLTPRILRADGREESAPAWTSHTLNVGDTLETGPVRGGVAYLAVSGGLATPPQLGSRSTYQRALIGGLAGRLLGQGDLLPSGAVADPTAGERSAPPWTYPDEPIRVLLGPQDGHFTPAAIEDFLGSDYRVTPQMDRMGMRLEGRALAHRTPECADIVSDGVTPGAIQVPGNGQPIILLADCQTVGGYPKIATVISADLPRLAQVKPGQSLRFQAVDAGQAKAARLARQDDWRAWQERIVSLAATPPAASSATDDDEDLYCAAV